ncbi:hypothetical protein ACLKA7_011651 [Drosophila subpalustris]
MRNSTCTPVEIERTRIPKHKSSISIQETLKPPSTTSATIQETMTDIQCHSQQISDNVVIIVSVVVSSNLPTQLAAS